MTYHIPGFCEWQYCFVLQIVRCLNTGKAANALQLHSFMSGSRKSHRLLIAYSLLCQGVTDGGRTDTVLNLRETLILRLSWEICMHTKSVGWEKPRMWSGVRWSFNGIINRRITVTGFFFKELFQTTVQCLSYSQWEVSVQWTPIVHVLTYLGLMGGK